MTKAFDISLHGSGRVAVIERVAHCCRYTPGLLYLDGEEGQSPVNFLRDMVELLRDEVDVVLLKDDCSDLDRVVGEILSQWRVYRDNEIGETGVQAIHHFLDVRAQYDQCALIVAERQLALDDDSVDFLMSLMARHSRLTVLLSGVFDVRHLLRIANQYEVSVNSIELPDISVERTSVAAQDDLFTGGVIDRKSSGLIKSLDHTFSDKFVDDFLDDDSLLEVVHDGELNAGFRAHGVHGSGSRYRGLPGGYGLWLLAAFGVALLLFISLRMPGQNQWPANAAVTAERKAVSAVENASSPPLPPPAALADKPPPVIGQLVRADVVPAESVILENAAQPGAVTRAGSTGAGVPELGDALGSVSEPSVSAELTAGTIVAVGAAPVSAIKKPEAVRKAKSDSVSVSDEDWKKHPDNYTVQLASAHNANNIQKLASALPPAHPYHIYRTVRDGRPWFVLLYGSFPNRAAAEAARDALGARAKSGTTPWVRKQGEILGH